MSIATVSHGIEYLNAARSCVLSSPMANTAIAVCELRGADAWGMVWFEGYQIPQWQAVIIEGMLLRSIAEETAREPR